MTGPRRWPWVVLACAWLWVSWPPRAAHAEGARVDLVTVGPADELFSRWGHIGLRVRADGEDLMYSYGNARYGGFGQLIDLLRGKAFFRLATRPWPKIFAWYVDHDRQVESWQLKLSPAKTQELIERLQINLRPMNREYRYDSLHDNCSTRVRDLLDEVTEGALRRAAAERVVDRHIRDDTRQAAAGSLLYELGLEVVIGPAQDTTPTGWEAMYRPVDLQQTAANAVLANGKPMLGPIEIEHVTSRQPATRLAAGAWYFIFGCAVATASAWAGWRPRSRAVRRIATAVVGTFGVLSGVLGLLVAVTMAIAIVPSLAVNENCVVFVPFDLAIVVAARRWWRGEAPVGRLGRVGRLYVRVRLAVLVALALAKTLGLSHQDNAWLIAAAAVALAALVWRSRDRGMNEAEA